MHKERKPQDKPWQWTSTVFILAGKTLAKEVRSNLKNVWYEKVSNAFRGK